MQTRVNLQLNGDRYGAVRTTIEVMELHHAADNLTIRHVSIVDRDREILNITVRDSSEARALAEGLWQAADRLDAHDRTVSEPVQGAYQYA